MRVTPVGLVARSTDDSSPALAQLQAALTHGHPTGLAASELTAYAVRLLRDGAALADLPGAAARRAAATSAPVYHDDWLGDLWQRPGAARRRTSSPGAGTSASASSTGWTPRCAARRRRRPVPGPARAGSPRRRWPRPCSAACCYADDPVGAGPRRHHRRRLRLDRLPGRRLRSAPRGHGAWPAPWAPQIEYADQLTTLARRWD